MYTVQILVKKINKCEFILFLPDKYQYYFSYQQVFLFLEYLCFLLQVV